MTGDSFDVHVLPVGKVEGFDNAGTIEEAKLAAAALARMGGRLIEPLGDGSLIDSLSHADESLARWSSRRAGGGRSSALLWFGHGQGRRVGAVLHVPRTGQEAGNAYLTPSMFAHHIHDEQVCRESSDDEFWTIVVVEACNGRAFVADVINQFSGTGRPEGRAVLLIGSGQTDGPAYLSQFRRRLDDYLDLMSHHDKVFTLRDIELEFDRDNTRFIARTLNGDAGAEFRLVPPVDVRGAGAITVADQQRLLAGRLPAPTPVGQAPTGASHLETAARFEGREEDLRAITEWATHPGGPPVFAVTGAPGAGKSALLAEAVRRGASGGLTDIVAVLPLTGSTPTDVVQRLATLPGSPGRNVPDLEPLRAHPPSGTEETPRLIVADALDEARDPVQVASTLRDFTTIPGVRLLIGTRPTPSHASPDGQDEAGVNLLEVLGSRTGHAHVWTVEPDAEAARNYAEHHIRRLVEQHLIPGEGRLDLARTIPERVASHVRTGAWHFLQATLVIQEIEDRIALLSDGDALEELLRSDRRGLFRAAVARITEGMPTARAFLRALIYSHGRGLPRAEGVWERAAAGVAGDGLRDGDLALFLHRAAGYIMLDGEDRRSVYRLANRSFAEQLLETGDTEQERFGMFSALLGLADLQVRRGERLSPHLSARLAEYAADCRARGWAALAERIGVLDRLPMPTLTALALSPHPDTDAAAINLPIEVLGTVTSAHLIETSEQDDRPGLRQLGGLRATGRAHPAGPGAAWHIRWGRMRRTPAHLQLQGVDGAVSAVASAPESSWLATGALDGTVLVWEPWRWHRPTRVLRDSDSAVSAIAACGGTEDKGPALLASAHENQTVQVWDLTVTPPTRHRHASHGVVRAMVALPGEPGRFAVAGGAGYVALLDAAGTTPQETEPPSRSEIVGMVAITGRGGEQFVVTAQQSGHLGLWRADGAAPRLTSAAVAHGELSGVAATATSAAPARLVTTPVNGVVEYWKLDADNSLVLDVHAQQGPEREDPGRLAVPALFELSGRIASAFGRGDGTLMVARPDGGFESVVMGTKAVRSVRVLHGPHSRPVLAVTVERDRRVHFWDPSVPVGFTDDTQAHPPADGMWRHVLPDGTEALVVVEKRDGSTRETLLASADGAELTAVGPTSAHALVRGDVPPHMRTAAVQFHGRVVDEVVLAAAGEKPSAPLVATAGRDCNVVIWWLSAAGYYERIRVIRLGSPCRSLVALSEGRLAVSLDDGVLVLDLGRSYSSEGMEDGDD